MTDVNTIIKGSFEDDQGRILHPETEASFVSMADGKSVEAKVAELLAKFSDYIPKNGGGVINGSLETSNGHISADQWLGISSGSDGHVLFGQNCYKDHYANTYKYLQTHESMGAKGLIFRHGSPGMYYFDTGMVPTVKDQEFTPDFKRLDKPDAEIITGQNLNDLTQNGVYCGSGLSNAPFSSSDWWYVWVQNLTNNSVNYLTQFAVAVNQQAMYQRGRRNGVWDPWQRTVTLTADGSAAYIPIPRYGPESGRGGYIGFADGGNTMYLSNDISGGDINILATKGAHINGVRIPLYYYSTSAPNSGQGNDGDVWDVYV